MTHALDVARNYLEGTKKNVSFGIINQRKESTMKHIKALMSKDKGKQMNGKLLLRR